MKDIRYGRDTLSEHKPCIDRKDAICWIKHIDEWHSKDPFAQKEKKEMIKKFGIREKLTKEQKERYDEIKDIYLNGKRLLEKQLEKMKNE